MKNTAVEILTKGAEHIKQRSETRDKAGSGEKTMERTIRAFYAMYGVNLTVEQGWQFMTLLKMSRASAGKFNLDDYEDGAAYFALAGEAAHELDVMRREDQSMD
ncbi:DUF6378 domain-containing protein [Sansalvadorimonas verongulae]|uniref:DUF6378 domain-containing protein n=1 Tax=Sansalvadorimonas verongulae TaxID=2172824 RepID=UPI0012BC0C98|nr:DUF6378 domain-containing protein [Sansalvadorimonas verongulae]MTI12370.1 hypothetical protein [Sansalvadorimonas verongulae]